MHKNELIFQKLDNPELIKVAKTLKNEGIILQNENYAYLKISEDFIHKLYPLMSPYGDKKSLAFRRREDIMKLL